MSTRERDQQAEQDRLQREQQQQQEQERTGATRTLQVEGDDEASNNPVIINK